MYRRAANSPAVFLSESVHQRAYHAERLCGAHSAEAPMAAQGLHRHKRKAPCDKSGGAALNICFCSSGHTVQLLFERFPLYYLQIFRINTKQFTDKCCIIHLPRFVIRHFMNFPSSRSFRSRLFFVMFAYRIMCSA